MRLSDLTFVVEVCCFLTSLFFLWKNRDVFSKITIAYLALVLLTETLGTLWSVIYRQNNSWIYNIYSIFETGYISIGFYYLLGKNKLLTLAVYATFLVSYSFETSYHGFFKYHAVTNTIVSVCFVVLSLVYFFRLVKHEKAFDLQFYSPFWWTAAVLIYYFGGTMYNLFVFYAIQYNQSFSILVHTMLVLNFLLYGIWSYSYICSYRHRKLLPSLS